MPEVYSPVGADLSLQTSTPLFKLGTRARCSDDQQYLYVRFSGAITQYWALAIDEDFVARGCTSALAAQANAPGFAQMAFTTQYYGWAAVHGANLFAFCRDNVATNSQLYTTPSVGKLTATASTGNPLLINGLRSATAAASGGGATEVLATYPSFNPTPKPVA